MSRNVVSTRRPPQTLNFRPLTLAITSDCRVSSINPFNLSRAPRLAALARVVTGKAPVQYPPALRIERCLRYRVKKAGPVRGRNLFLPILEGVFRNGYDLVVCFLPPRTAGDFVGAFRRCRFRAVVRQRDGAHPPRP